MRLRGSAWHIAILALSSSVSGCFLTHELDPSTEPPPVGPSPTDPRPTEPTPTDPRPTPRPTEPIPPGPVPAPLDAGIAPADAGPDAMIDRCAPLFAAMREGRLEEIGCDGRTFRDECFVEVNPCCQIWIYCATEPTDGGHLAAALSCDDSCAQHCETYSRDGCALAGCEWFDPGACGPAPEGVIEGPTCTAPRGEVCTTDGECPVGTVCRSYFVDPCAGSACDACGGTEQRCAR